MTQVKKGSIVKISYNLHLDNIYGEKIESVPEEQAAEFEIGAGEMLEALEEVLMDKKVGDSFEVEIPKEKAFGDIDGDLILEIPKNNFAHDGEVDEELIKPGNIVEMEDQEGNPVHVEIIEIKGENVLVDLNHPLAGEQIYFRGKLVGIE